LQSNTGGVQTNQPHTFVNTSNGSTSRIMRNGSTTAHTNNVYLAQTPALKQNTIKLNKNRDSNLKIYQKLD